VLCDQKHKAVYTIAVPKCVSEISELVHRLPVHERVAAVQDKVGTWHLGCQDMALWVATSLQVLVTWVRVGGGLE